MLYSASPNLIIGFHGCDENTRDKLLTNPDKIEISKEKYDWAMACISGKIIMSGP
jgi:hypothetical protein